MSIFAQHNDIQFAVGDTIRVNYKIIERVKKVGTAKREVKEEVHERIQPFEGIVVGIKGGSATKSFTIRKIASYNVAVERIIPISSPWLKSIEIVSQGKVRRGKLGYLRTRTGKSATYIKPKVVEEKKIVKKAKSTKVAKTAKKK
ncbi:50S ribosomal protein L19 [Candidatus Roizmanbacteria bacterium CG22_combo_CG10-13_8_21_14_all_38_20]|uniref:50S ribosomal protein L19 n=1 Tax=Candidatus Roizmanbacteria bacterium CG22_combo_CG10-13_8_21_14_all_38_20 TaxID=1974862 RepID=A0A2H0BV32_9BACT|nr:50S ribosomal protein L19 [Candidatus Microgenomates bacterium]PIP61546.1 MAG: 50S ribosomal protein L19 [Candidatus Roizmanbacteria bacterium CG22_combo_CG10-13_8_21_14_all_38_20]PJC31500.1 MAG: 50S ribosomal protein L19 [Candidatus Roizmanbacteria bacterium CG_4_9_14_0_2_um_filter_38_17]